MNDPRTVPVLRRALGLALAAALAAVGSVSAQAHGEKGGHGMPAGGMHGGHGAMLGHVPAAILHQGDLLELTDGQKERLEALKDSLASLREEGHGRDGDLKQADVESAFTESGIDVEAYESALRSMADRHVAARVEVARIARRALQVLDEDQREKFLYGVHLMHRMHRMHHGGHGDVDMRPGEKMHHGGMKEMEEKEGGGR